jgi:hypothetical protein
MIWKNYNLGGIYVEKRYQVFISSTFADLIEERKGVMEAILALNCFPAGMEMFPASDIEQFEYIKTIIDQSDYYVLIIAGRYGSVAEDGISFTEKEYDYAKSKGIPILAFIKKDIISIPVGKTDEDPVKKEKLAKFREKALDKRLGKLWNSSEELKYLLHTSLSNEFKIHPRRGWIQGDIENSEILLRQLNDLRVENGNLKKEMEIIKVKVNQDYENDICKINTSNLAQGDSEYAIHYILTYDTDDAEDIVVNKILSLTWNDIFYGVGLKLMSDMRYKSLENILNEVIFKEILSRFDYPSNADLELAKVEIDEIDYTTITLQLTHLDLIDRNSRSDFYVLTDKGKKIIVDNLLVRNS